MTTTPQSSVADEHGHVDTHRSNRLYQTAAWVAIVAGVIFIIGAVFFTGYTLGRHSGNGWGWGQGRMYHGGPMMPMMDHDDHPGGMMGPGMMGPGAQSSAPPPPPRS